MLSAVAGAFGSSLVWLAREGRGPGNAITDGAESSVDAKEGDCQASIVNSISCNMKAVCDGRQMRV